MKMKIIFINRNNKTQINMKKESKYKIEKILK